MLADMLGVALELLEIEIGMIMEALAGDLVDPAPDYSTMCLMPCAIGV
jgi:hypothetical protein